MEMPFGKYAGWEVADVPPDYLRWLLRNVHLRSPDLRAEVEEVVGEAATAQPEPDQAGWTRRAQGGTGWAPPPPPPRPPVDVDGMVRDLVDALNRWRRKQAAAHHPDRGGDLRVMQAINVAGDELLTAIEEAVKRHRR